MQAQGLRTRLEMRVNRIPQGLRKRNIQDLIDEHAAKNNPKPAAPIPVLQKQAERTTPLSAKKSLKRTRYGCIRRSRGSRDLLTLVSEHFADEDKENAPAEPYAHDLANPKKRTKTATTTANMKATRTASQKAPPTVLSPRSANSRTLPRSPLKAASPEKPAFSIARPASAVKPVVTQTHAISSKPSSRAPSRQTKRPAPARAAALNNTEGRDSESSTTSAGTSGTTIVTKQAAKKAPATRKAAPAKTTTVAAKKTAAAKKEAAPAPVPPAGGRTLRKRG